MIEKLHPFAYENISYYLFVKSGETNLEALYK